MNNCINNITRAVTNCVSIHHETVPKSKWKQKIIRNGKNLQAKLDRNLEQEEAKRQITKYVSLSMWEIAHFLSVLARLFFFVPVFNHKSCKEEWIKSHMGWNNKWFKVDKQCKLTNGKTCLYPRVTT